MIPFLIAVIGVLAFLLWRAVAAHTEARVRLAALERDLAAGADKASWVDAARSEIEKTFKAIASDTVAANRSQLVAEADHAVRPLNEALVRLEGKIGELESSRAGAYAGLLSEISALREAHGTLADRAASLSSALTSHGAQGRWGEMTLRRIAELSGMTHHVHIESQVTSGDQRPDMLVKIPGGGDLPVDAKVTLNDYLVAMGEADSQKRSVHLKAHALAVKRRITELGRKEYWKQFAPSPEFVVMFVPIEASLGAAFEHEPELLEFAASQRVLIATPVTLLALLKAVAFGWQQRQVTDNLRLIEAECRTLYERLGGYLRSVAETGEKLEATVKSYNKMVGSAESRLLPSARRLHELGAGSEAPIVPGVLEGSARVPRDEAQA